MNALLWDFAPTFQLIPFNFIETIKQHSDAFAFNYSVPTEFQYFTTQGGVFYRFNLIQLSTL